VEFIYSKKKTCDGCFELREVRFAVVSIQIRCNYISFSFSHYFRFVLMCLLNLIKQFEDSSKFFNRIMEFLPINSYYV